MAVFTDSRPASASRPRRRIRASTRVCTQLRRPPQVHPSNLRHEPAFSRRTRKTTASVFAETVVAPLKPRATAARPISHAELVALFDGRAEIESMVERLIGILDQADAVDEDLEDDGTAEPTMGAVETTGGQGSWARGDNSAKADECELEDEGEHDEDLERGGDEEPSLGSLDDHVDQGAWSGGNTVDLALEDYGRLVRRAPDLPLSNLEQIRPGVLLWKGGRHV